MELGSMALMQAFVLCLQCVLQQAVQVWGEMMKSWPGVSGP